MPEVLKRIRDLDAVTDPTGMSFPLDAVSLGATETKRITADAFFSWMSALLASTYQPLDGDLTAISALATTGVVRRTGTNTWTAGTITASNISDFDTQVRTSRLDQMAVPTADVSMNSHKLTNLSTPTSSGDAVTKAYADGLITGMTPRTPAKVATTTQLTSTSYNNGSSGVGATFFSSGNATLTIDGYAVQVGDYVLIKDQTGSASRNGLYVMTQLGDGSHPWILTRAIGMDQSDDFLSALVAVEDAGPTNANSLWLCTNSGTVVIGTTAITFTQLNKGTDLQSGTGIQISGNTVSVTGNLLSLRNLPDASDFLVNDGGGTLSWRAFNSIDTVGTITTGTWNGDVIDIAHGGTGQGNEQDAVNALLSALSHNTGDVLYINGSNVVYWDAPPSGGSGTPGGSNTQIQFNNSGSFGGTAEMSYASGVALNLLNIDMALTDAPNGITFSGTTTGTGAAIQPQGIIASSWLIADNSTRQARISIMPYDPGFVGNGLFVDASPDGDGTIRVIINGGTAYFYPNSSSDNGVIIKAAASHSADLFQVTNNSSVVLDKINASGDLTIQPAVRSTGSPNHLVLTGAAHTTLTASTEAIDVNINLARTVQFAAGTLATQRAFVIQAPTYAFASASTLTNAYTLFVTGAPAAGTNATLTKTFAAFFQAGHANGVPLAVQGAASQAKDLLAIYDSGGTLLNNCDKDGYMFPVPGGFNLGVGAPATTGTNLSCVIQIPANCKIVKVFAYAKTGPTGADMIFDINYHATDDASATTIWSTQANRLKIVAGSKTGSQTTFDTTTFAEGGVLTIDLDQVGSTIAGQDITVTVWCRSKESR